MPSTTFHKRAIQYMNICCMLVKIDARWLCLNDDGVFVRVFWQVQTDRTDAKGSGTDQWIGMTRSTKLEALWVQVHNIEQISLSDQVKMSWDDALELRPRQAIKLTPACDPKGTRQRQRLYEYATSRSKDEKGQDCCRLTLQATRSRVHRSGSKFRVGARLSSKSRAGIRLRGSKFLGEG
mgnify:CR=1 FL=1